MNGKEKILDQLKNNHRRKWTRMKPRFGPGMSSPSEARRNRVNDKSAPSRISLWYSVAIIVEEINWKRTKHYLLSYYLVPAPPRPPLTLQRHNTQNLKQIFPEKEYINRPQTHECGNLDWGRAISFLGIHNWDFRCSTAIPYLSLFSLCVRNRPTEHK